MRKLACYALFFVSLIFVISCAAPSIKTTMLLPAQYYEASQIKEVAVLPFDGTGGKEFAAEIESALASVNIGDKQYFSIVDRVRLDKVLSEMKLSQSALVDEGTAAKVGKLVGAKGIYTGVISEAGIEESKYTEERRRCTRTVTKRDKTGKTYTTTEDYILGKYEKCAGNIERYTASCIKRIAIFNFTPKLIEVETSKVIYSNSIKKSIDVSACSDSQKPITGGAELLGKARELARQTFRTDVAPHYITVDIKLMDTKEGVGAKDARAKLEQGVAFAKSERLDRACELWGEARILAPNSPAIMYNLGVCSEITGDLEKSLDLYRKADKLLTKPDEKITAALVRVQKRMDDQKKLK